MFIKKLIQKVKDMELGNPIITTLVGLVVFYIGLKMFSGGMKSMGNLDHLAFFTHNTVYMFFGGIIMTLLWQSSSLSTTAIIALVASGAIPFNSIICALASICANKVSLLASLTDSCIESIVAKFSADAPVI